MGPQPKLYMEMGYIFVIYALCQLDGTTGYIICTFLVNIPNILCYTCMGPQLIVYMEMGYVFVICTVLVVWDHLLYYTYIFREYPQYIVDYLHGTTAYIIPTDWVYVHYMHCVSWMGQLAILYIHFAGICLIYSWLLAWDHSLYYTYRSGI